MKKKKLAAAIAAVSAYIKTEEEAAAYYGMAAPAAPEEPLLYREHPAGNFPKPNLWGITGRQSQMQARSMMQLRMFR